MCWLKNVVFPYEANVFLYKNKIMENRRHQAFWISKNSKNQLENLK